MRPDARDCPRRHVCVLWAQLHQDVRTCVPAASVLPTETGVRAHVGADTRLLGWPMLCGRAPLKPWGAVHVQTLSHPPGL